MKIEVGQTVWVAYLDKSMWSGRPGYTRQATVMSVAEDFTLLVKLSGALSEDWRYRVSRRSIWAYGAEEWRLSETGERMFFSERAAKEWLVIAHLTRLEEYIVETMQNKKMIESNIRNAKNLRDELAEQIQKMGDQEECGR